MKPIIQEIGGSPIETYTQDSFAAKRIFILPWNQRSLFAKCYFGNRLYSCSSSLGIETVVSLDPASTSPELALSYPEMSDVLVVKIVFEPLDPESLDISQVVEPALRLGNYKSYAKATVYYESQMLTVDRSDSPEVVAGTSLTYKMISSVETIPIAARDLFWQDDASLPVSDDLVVNRRVPVAEHHLVWKNVVSPPWDTISEMQGTVNASTFLGYPPETLLFEGAEAYKIYNSSLQNGAVGYTWQIRYIFREKRVQFGAATYGWNHFRRSSPAGWVRLTDGTNNIYQTADHSQLFVSSGSVG